LLRVEVLPLINRSTKAPFKGNTVGEHVVIVVVPFRLMGGEKPTRV
jgi:hypothetical protein